MPLKIAFDIDDTLWKCRYDRPNCDENCPTEDYCTVHRPKMDQIPDYDLIQVLRWFHQNGDEIIFWSAGGMDYCKDIITKLGLNHLGIVAKKGSFKPDIAFDDCETQLAKVDVRVNRFID